MEPSASLTPPAASILWAAALSAAWLLVPNDFTGPVSVPNAAIRMGRRSGTPLPAASAVLIVQAASAPNAMELINWVAMFAI
jgi:hypothetical protein